VKPFTRQTISPVKDKKKTAKKKSRIENAERKNGTFFFVTTGRERRNILSGKKENPEKGNKKTKNRQGDESGGESSLKKKKRYSQEKTKCPGRKLYSPRQRGRGRPAGGDYLPQAMPDFEDRQVGKVFPCRKKTKRKGKEGRAEKGC